MDFEAWMFYSKLFLFAQSGFEATKWNFAFHLNVLDNGKFLEFEAWMFYKKLFLFAQIGFEATEWSFVPIVEH